MSVEFVDELPKRKTGTGKKQKVEDTYRELVESLKANPNKWGSLATGKAVTLSRNRQRLEEVFGPEGYEFATRAGVEPKTAVLYGRWVHTFEDDRPVEEQPKKLF